MTAPVSEMPKMGVEMMLERIMGAMEKQNEELFELRKECSDLRLSNKSMEIMLQNIAQQGRNHSPPSLSAAISPSVSRDRAQSPFLPRHSVSAQTGPSQVLITSPTRELPIHSYPFPDREILGFYVVIPAGGAGTRLWPLSRENHPKFLLDVNLCGNSLLQSTWERLLPLAGPSRMTVVAGPAHSEGILGQLPNLAVSNLFTEPGPKDSMAAIGLAAAILLRRDPDAVIGSFAADHMISGEEAFLAAVTEAVEVAREGYLVTIGIAPSHPATGFGYIRLGERLSLKSAPHSRLVSSFKEKPDAHTAAKYLATGQYRWNAGMFVTKASLLMELLKEHCPALYEGLTNISEVWDDEVARKVALEEVWPMLEKIPIDNAVAEPAAAQGKVAVIPATFGWDDVGDFSSLAEMLPAESNKPRVLGDQRLVVSEQTAGGIVVPVSGRLITCLGVDDIVIVDAPDALMVTTRARSQEVKSLVKKCREAGWKNLL
ncbi:nucleotide-diphospho-sugar transferase [Trichoderma ceciliae]